MNDIIEINRLIKHSQCLIKKQNNWLYLLYDEYNEYKVKEYEKLDLNIVLNDIKSHLALNIQDNLVENTVNLLTDFLEKKYSISVSLTDEYMDFSMKDWKKRQINIKEFDSLNIKCLKLTIVDKLELI